MNVPCQHLDFVVSPDLDDAERTHLLDLARAASPVAVVPVRIDEAGDTTITDYGVYRIEDGELVCDETVRAAQ